ncbi:MAG: ketopantoate reductase family protein [Candidatus Hodarchaeales archaeon]|jgi:2-dehydropantoate 2-reductase
MLSQKPIYILGTGAIGVALAVNLINHNKNVILVKTSRDDISEEKKQISLEDKQGKIARVSISLVSLNKLKKLNGTIVITAKSHANGKLASKLSGKKVNSPLVVMQNGLGVEKPFIEKGFTEIYRCILFVTSQTTNEYQVRYRPIKPSPIGIIKGNLRKLQEIVNLLTTPDFSFQVNSEIINAIWQKAIINSVFNSICPLLNIDNGIFFRNKEATQIASEIIDECILVASTEGIELNKKEILEQVLNISKISSGQLISTLQDLNNNRKTEIDSLNLEIARIAKTNNQGLGIKKTELLGTLIRIKSSLQDGYSTKN